MKKVDIDVIDAFGWIVNNIIDAAVERDPTKCFLLASVDDQGKPNVKSEHMVAPCKAGPFGWGFYILSMSDQYTTTLIDQSGDFTLNLPRLGMEDVVKYCGRVSGREEDKLQAMNLSAIPSRIVSSPIIQECCMHFECEVNIVAPVLLENTKGEDIKTVFGNGFDIISGIIKAAYADEDIAHSFPEREILHAL
jgi:flavin reductase (DIM6/NTAB) family NADH-FMN oxidoreductase RutF